MRCIGVAFAVAGLACAVPTGAQVAAKPAQHPVQSFAELPFMAGPKLSPDGTKVAAQVAIKGEQRLMIIPIDDFGKSVQVPIGDNDLNWWRWVNDEWLVVGIGNTQAVNGEDWHIRRAVSIRADGGVINPLAFRVAAQGADDVLWVANAVPRESCWHFRNPYFQATRISGLRFMKSMCRPAR